MRRVSLIIIALSAAGCSVYVKTMDEVVNTTRAKEAACYEARNYAAPAAVGGYALLGPLGAVLAPGLMDKPIKCGLSLHSAINTAKTMAYASAGDVTLVEITHIEPIVVGIEEVKLQGDCMTGQLIISMWHNGKFLRHKKPTTFCKKTQRPSADSKPIQHPF